MIGWKNGRPVLLRCSTDRRNAVHQIDIPPQVLHPTTYTLGTYVSSSGVRVTYFFAWDVGTSGGSSIFPASPARDGDDYAPKKVKRKIPKVPFKVHSFSLCSCFIQSPKNILPAICCFSRCWMLQLCKTIFISTWSTGLRTTY